MDDSTISAVADAGAAASNLEDRTNLFPFRGVDVPIALVGSMSDGMKVVVLDDVARFAEERADGPERRAGQRQLHDVASFITYVNRFKTPEVIVYVSKTQPMVLAVFDENAEGATGKLGWRRDRAWYAPTFSKPWVAWVQGVAKGGYGMKQDPFADWIEDHLDDVHEEAGFPKKLDLVEMARNLHVNIGHKYQRTLNPTTGEATLVSITDAGQSATKIPKEFLLAIPVFEGGEPYKVRIALRMNLGAEGAVFTMTARNVDPVIDDAFAGIRKAIAEKCGVPVLAGEAT